MFEQRRTIRLFVSSTFLDMQAERDLLHREVFPGLKRLCLERGLQFQPIDLRWGVSEEASRHNRTMRICLRELARCQEGGLRPNFLILLGERYGWRPLPEVIPADLFERLRPAAEQHSAESARALAWYRLDENADPPAYVLLPRDGEMADYERWHEDAEAPLMAGLRHACADMNMSGSTSKQDQIRLESLGIGLSATHQEIVKGALQVADAANHVHAFVRTGMGDSVAGPELEALIKDIEGSIGSGNVHDYAEDLEGFGDEVLRSLTTIVEQEAARLKKIPVLDKESDLHRRYGQNLRRNFLGRKGQLACIADYVDHGQSRPLVVLGGSGEGKSALIAQAAEQARATGCLVIERFIGASPRSADVLTLLSDVAEEIGRGFGESGEERTDDDASIRNATGRLRDAIQSAKAERPLALFLDGLDQLGEGTYGRTLNWLPRQLPDRARLVASCTTPSVHSDPTDARNEVYYAVASRFAPEDCVLMEPLSEQDGSTLLDTWLSEKNRVLQPTQRAAVLKAFLRHGNALWLKVAATESAGIPSWAEPPCLPEELVDLTRHVMSRLAAPLEYGRKLVEHTGGYLSAARRGLSESDLTDLLSADADVMEEFRQRFPKAPKAEQLPMAVWVALRGELETYLGETQHYGATLLSFAQSSFRESFLEGEMEDEREYHRVLARYFRCQEMTGRALEELPWQLVRAEDWDGLADLLSKQRNFSDLFRLSRSDAKYYWTCLERSSGHKMLEAFAEVVRNPGASLKTSLDVADLMDETAYPEEARKLLEGIIRHCRYPEDLDFYLACKLRLGLLQMSSWEYAECEKTFRESMRIAQVNNRRELQGSALLNLAIAQRIQRKLKSADMLTDLFLGEGYENGLGKAYETKGLIAEARDDHSVALEWFDQALREAEESGDDDLRREVLEHRAWVLTEQGHFPQGEYDLTQLASHYDRIGDMSGSASARSRLGVLEKDRGNPAAALDMYKRAAEFEHHMGRPVGEAMLLDNQAEALIRMRRMTEALPLNLEAIRIFREKVAEQHLAVALLNHAVMQQAMGNQEAAEAALAESQSLSHKIGDAATTGRTLVFQGEMLRLQGRFADAESADREAITVLEAAGTKDALAVAHGELGVLLARDLGRSEEGLDEFEAAIEIGKQRDLQGFLIELLEGIAAIYEQIGDDEVVLDACRELAPLATRHQDAEAGALAMLFSSNALSRTHRHAEALEAAKRGLLKAQESRSKHLSAAANLTLAMRLRDCGEALQASRETLEAESIYETVGDWDGVISSRLFRAQTLNFDLGRKAEAAELLSSAVTLDQERNQGLRQRNLKMVLKAIRGGSPLDQREVK
jgi:tetratricopeptide (TPR) repeat protein